MARRPGIESPPHEEHLGGRDLFKPCARQCVLNAKTQWGGTWSERRLPAKVKHPLRQLTSNKDVREEIDVLLCLGFGAAEFQGDGHLRMTHPQHGDMTLPVSPSSRSWKLIHRKRTAKLMGLNMWQLNRLIAGQPLTKRTVRETGPGRRTNEEVIVAHAAELGIEIDRPRAGRLLSRFGTVRASRVALDGMAREALQKAA